MPLFIVNKDITAMTTDAIVNVANNSRSFGSGVDEAIYRAAGIDLVNEFAKLNGCDTGDAKITNAYNLPCRNVIHTVGPVWTGGQSDEEMLLASCYKKSLQLAKENGLKSIAFPLISTGLYGYPKVSAIKVATSTIKEFLFHEEMDVYLIIPDKNPIVAPKELLHEMQKYSDKNERGRIKSARKALFNEQKLYVSCYEDEKLLYEHSNLSIANSVKNLDESFSEMLLRLIDEKGMTDVECYKKANISRKVFSKIRNTKEYRPSKTTAVAFAIALQLQFDQAKRLIELAGYSLTHNNKFDIIVEYFIKHKNYDIFEINEVLFKFDQKLLGC